jgi:Zn-dependent protease with chaperone function
MPFLLMVFLVLVCLPEPEIWPKPLWTDSPLACVAATWLTVLFIGLHAFIVAFRFRKPLETNPSLREQLLVRYDRGRFRQQSALFVLYILAVLGLGWGWAVSQLWRGSNGALPGAELLILSPFVLAQLLAWTAYYDAERATHQAAHRLLAEAHANGWLELEHPPASVVTPFGSRASYVLFQLRQKLALVFLPVLLLLVQRELQRLFPQTWQEWQKAVNFLGIAAVLVVFTAMPWILRLVLGLKPLPAGSLRQRLEASARRLRFRCSNILVWNTRRGMANAMVIGILPWLRYVVFTDRLLDDFTPDEIEAVFGHEVGHIRHHHMLYYFSFLTASVLVLGWLITDVVVSYLGPIPFVLDNHSSDCVSAISLVAVLLAYIFVVFGFLSRRCERQADVFGCRAVSCACPDCGGHENEVAFAPHGQGLCATGINTFIRALEKVASVNGISRDRPGFLQSWQHASIGRRIEFLQQMLLDPGVERRFQRRVFLFKALLLLVLGGAVAFILFQEAKAPAVDPIRAATARER